MTSERTKTYHSVDSVVKYIFKCIVKHEHVNYVLYNSPRGPNNVGGIFLAKENIGKYSKERFTISLQLNYAIVYALFSKLRFF